MVMVAWNTHLGEIMMKTVLASDGSVAGTRERTWRTPNFVAFVFFVFVVLSRRRNAQCEQQSHRKSKHGLHDSITPVSIPGYITSLKSAPQFKRGSFNISCLR